MHAFARMRELDAAPCCLCVLGECDSHTETVLIECFAAGEPTKEGGGKSRA